MVFLCHTVRDKPVGTLPAKFLTKHSAQIFQPVIGEDKLNYPISAATGIGKRAKHTDKWDQVRAALNKPMSVHHWKSQLALEGNNSVALNIDRKASGHMLVQFSERPSDTSAVENTSRAAL